MPLYNPTSVTVASSTSGVAIASSVIASFSSVSLLAVNPSRKGATIFNNSTANLYVELGEIANIQDFTVRVASFGYYEIPFTYTGEISGAWDAVNGAALVREFVEVLVVNNE
ncbi:MAG: hypothetical protein KME54_27595 [Tolypothrix brevis GSE-NOS-MK-07-07A]|jgi:hypothetical protein|nr:hypothetical protein [Tolypothrix brevis GSE-NOS-MK-07-07A]